MTMVGRRISPTLALGWHEPANPLGGWAEIQSSFNCDSCTIRSHARADNNRVVAPVKVDVASLKDVVGTPTMDESGDFARQSCDENGARRTHDRGAYP